MNESKNTKKTQVIAKLLAIAFLYVSLSSCFTHEYNINDGCDILDKRSWAKAVKASSQKWNVPPELFLAFIYQESKFKKNARPPKKRILWVIPTVRPSSAYGYAQALTSTWSDYRKSTKNYSAKRTDFRDAVDFIGWYVDRAAKIINKPSTDVYSHYLAYHDGAGGFNKGTYLKKNWLIGVARKVERHSQQYKQQLKQCGIN